MGLAPDCVFVLPVHMSTDKTLGSKRRKSRLKRDRTVTVRVAGIELQRMEERFPRGLSTAMRRLALCQPLEDPSDPLVPRIGRGRRQEWVREWTEVLTWSAQMVADIRRVLRRSKGALDPEVFANAEDTLREMERILEEILKKL
jgi:hypothetical protein